jgi:hypothetical protein
MRNNSNQIRKFQRFVEIFLKHFPLRACGKPFFLNIAEGKKKRFLDVLLDAFIAMESNRGEIEIHWRSPLIAPLAFCRRKYYCIASAQWGAFEAKS